MNKEKLEVKVGDFFKIRAYENISLSDSKLTSFITFGKEIFIIILELEYNKKIKNLLPPYWENVILHRVLCDNSKIVLIRKEWFVMEYATKL